MFIVILLTPGAFGCDLCLKCYCSGLVGDVWSAVLSMTPSWPAVNISSVLHAAWKQSTSLCHLDTHRG